DADEPDSAVQARRARGRSAPDVSGRYLYCERKPGRSARNQRAVWFLGRQPADRSAADGTPLRRKHAAQNRRRLRTRYRMVDATASDHELKPGDWAALPDDKLLDVRMCDLGGLSIEGTDVEARIAAIDKGPTARAVKFRPRYWLSVAWITPDGVP